MRCECACVFFHKLKVINLNTVKRFKARFILTSSLSLIIYKREFIFSSLRSDLSELRRDCGRVEECNISGHFDL